MTFFGSDTFERRRAAACKFLAANHLRAVIIGPGPEFEYLTGTQIDTHERLSAIVLTDEGNATVVLPSTDAGSFPSDDPALISIGWRDGEDPYEIVYKLIASPADSATPPIIGLGSTLTADHVLALQRYPFKTCLAQDALSSLFMVKDDDEIAQLAQAAEAIDRVHALVPSLLTPGITERTVADALHTAILEEHTAVDFIIVGSGPNGATLITTSPIESLKQGTSSSSISEGRSRAATTPTARERILSKEHRVAKSSSMPTKCFCKRNRQLATPLGLECEQKSSTRLRGTLSPSTGTASGLRTESGTALGWLATNRRSWSPAMISS